MLVRLIVVALCLTTCRAEIEPWETAWTDNDVNEGSPCEAKVAVLLNKIKSETDAKLMLLEKNIQHILEATNSKNSEIEDMPDKLEKYLDRKFDLLIKLLLEENTSRKLKELENKMVKLETMAGLNFNVRTTDQLINNNYEKLANTTCDKIDRNINSKLDTIQKELRDFRNYSSHCHSDLLDKKLHELQRNINKTSVSLDKVVEDVDNVTSQFSDTNGTMKKIAYEQNIKKKLKLCKEHVAHGYHFKPMYRLNNETFGHVALKTDSNAVTEFEMHIAVKADAEAIVLLSPTPNPKNGDTGYEIVMGAGGYNNRTDFRTTILYKVDTSIETQNILSRTDYKTFTVKIFKGKHLEFVENTYGSEKEIIRYSNPDLRLVNYFGFSAWHRSSWFLYDCPSW